MTGTMYLHLKRVFHLDLVDLNYLAFLSNHFLLVVLLIDYLQDKSSLHLYNAIKFFYGSQELTSLKNFCAIYQSFVNLNFNRRQEDLLLSDQLYHRVSYPGWISPIRMRL